MATVAELGVSVMRVSTVPLRCLPFSPTWSAADCWADPSSKATCARGNLGQGPAGRGEVGGGYLLGAAWEGRENGMP